MRIIIIIAIINSAAQTIPFHRITFIPSSGPNGSRLNVPSSALIRQINPRIFPINDVSKKTNRYRGYVVAAIIIFASGPATAILPISKFLVSPRNITAPGAAKTNPVKTAKNNDSRSPLGYILNSDQRPYFCAMNLWDNS